MQTRIESISFIEIPESRRFYYRPYDITVDANQVAQLEQSVGKAVERGGEIQQNMLPGGILRPQTSPVADVLLPGGWETTRYTFIIKVVSVSEMGEVVYYITGYTAETDPSISGYMDPDTMLYINNMMEIQQRVFLRNINTMLHDHASAEASFDTERRTVARLQDVVDNNTFSIDNNSNINLMAKFTLDRGGRLVRSEENISIDYLTKAINMWIGKLNSEMIEQYVETDVVRGGYNLPRSEEPGWDTPIRILKHNGIGLSNSIQYKDLLYMDSTVPSRTTVSEYSPINANGFINPSDCEDWMSSTEEAAIASTAAIEFPQLMLSSGVVSCNIVYSNIGTPDPKGELTILTPILFGGLDINRHTNILKTRMMNEVIHTITRNYTIPLSFKATVSLIGVSTIEVYLETGAAVYIPFNIPAFATGSYSPLIMPGHESFNNFCSYMNNIEEVVRGVYNDAIPGHPQYQNHLSLVS